MYRTQLRTAGLTAGLLLTTVLAAQPATAWVDPGPLAQAPAVTTETEAHLLGTCPLRRVDTQLVRCDDLTGGNATAPAHVPERR